MQSKCHMYPARITQCHKSPEDEGGLFIGELEGFVDHVQGLKGAYESSCRGPGPKAVEED